MVKTLIKGWACIIATGVLFIMALGCGNLGLAFICCAGGVFFLNLACKVVNNGPDEMKKIMAEYEREQNIKKSIRAERRYYRPPYL